MLNKTTKINFSLGFIFFDTVKYKGKNICVRIRNDKYFCQDRASTFVSAETGLLRVVGIETYVHPRIYRH